MAGFTSGMVSKEGFLAVSVLNRELKGLECNLSSQFYCIRKWGIPPSLVCEFQAATSPIAALEVA